MKKFIFSFILILLLILPSGVLAQDDIFSYSFVSEEEASFWSGCFYDESNPFMKGNSIFVNNPFGEVRGDKVTHVLEYGDAVALEGGKVYTLSGYVLNPLSGYSPSLRSYAHLENGANTVIVNIGGIGDEWAYFSTTFYAGEGGEYNLALHFGEGLVDFGFFVDELTLSETPCTISQLVLNGQTEILIPAEGTATVNYYPYLLTADNRFVNILSNSSVYASATNVPGVEFNPRDFSLTISSRAVTGTYLSIECALRNFEVLSPTSLTVELFDNMINNPSFEDDTLLWTSTSDIAVTNDDTNSYISVPTNDYGEYGYFASITYDTPQLLLEDVLYVMHAKIKSDCAVPFSAIYAKNNSECIDNTVYFNILDISGEDWIDVFAAFIPEVSGIYNVALGLYSTYDCTIFADELHLSSETLRPEYITLHAPGNIAVPDTGTDYRVSALLRDQLGNILGDENITVSLKETNDSIYFNSETNTLTVLPGAPVGEYTLLAVYDYNTSITAELSFYVSFDYIGDGSFENKQPNEWWMVTSPYDTDFYIRYDGYSKRALINCRGDYFMLLNNSYVHLTENTAYVFNSSFSVPVDCTATLFIESMDSEVYPLAQFTVKGGTTLDDKMSPALFLAEDSCVGRLFLYVQSDNGAPFSVYADNLSLKKAVVVAGNPHITGNPHVNEAVWAEFSFYNSVAHNTDSSASIINWYVSDTSSYDGFKMLPNGGPVIYLDTTFLNKYVYFEVIPICPITGFSGNTIKCLPFLVTYSGGISDTDTSSSQIISVPQFSSPDTENKFSDIKTHWGKEYIDLLSFNNVVNGKSNNLFAPDQSITRCEFSKIICNTFSINAYADFSPFEDVNRSDWYYDYICALNLNGIIKGITDSRFSPYSPLTREDAAVIIMRIYERTGKSTAATPQISFSDSYLISDYAVSSVNSATSLGILQGKEDGIFAPKDNLSRAEAAAVICRLVTALKRR